MVGLSLLSEQIETAQQKWDEMTDWEELNELMMVVPKNCSEAKVCQRLQVVPMVVVLDWNELTKRKEAVVTCQNRSLGAIAI